MSREFCVSSHFDILRGKFYLFWILPHVVGAPLFDRCRVVEGATDDERQVLADVVSQEVNGLWDVEGLGDFWTQIEF
jgi:hypothetical protein